MRSLPNGLAEPLHFEQPPEWGLPLIALLAALAGLVWWLRRRRRSAPTAAPPPPPAIEPQPTPGDSLAAAIRRILERYGHDPRAGCHALSGLLRRRLELRRKGAFSTLTAREIRRALGDTALVRLFDLLADLQFERRQPTHKDLRGACELAEEVGSVELA